MALSLNFLESFLDTHHQRKKKKNSLKRMDQRKLLKKVETPDVLTRDSWHAIPKSMMEKEFAASSFVNKDLTWWNTQVQAKGREAAIGMSWAEFKALLVEELCPSNEIEKLENEFWNHKMVGANHAAYTDLFHELAKLVPHLVTPESLRIKMYIAGTDIAKSQENGQNQTNTNTGTNRVHKSWKFLAKGQLSQPWSTLGQPQNDKTLKSLNEP
ncbi:reverse transcriptase domain-containing protein [Tanacetum coccineum]